jgi:predicted CoA-binding protein
MPDPIADLLRSAKTIAVVGMSANPEKDAHTVPKYMAEHGYRIIPVNPNATEILGLKVFKAITDVPQPVDIVDVFRPGPECDKVAEAAIKIRPRAVWLQLGITNPRAKQIVESAGIQYIEDRCLRVEHQRAFALKK